LVHALCSILHYVALQQQCHLTTLFVDKLFSGNLLHLSFFTDFLSLLSCFFRFLLIFLLQSFTSRYFCLKQVSRIR